MKKLILSLLLGIFLFSLVSSAQTNGDGWSYDGKFAGGFNANINVLSSILIKDTNSLRLENGNATECAWINKLDTSSTGYIISKRNSTSYSYAMLANGGNLQVINISNSNINLIPSGIEIGSWNYFCVIFLPNETGTYVNAYKNGILNSSTFIGDNFSTSDIPLAIGSRFNTQPSPTTRFNGSIDNVQIWNTTLSQDNITTLYNAGRVNSPCNLITTGQVLCIDFDDMSLKDNSGNGNNGINTNVSFVEVQGNYRTLVEGVDYLLNKKTGVVTLLNTLFNYNYLMVTYHYDKYYSNGSSTNAIFELIQILVTIGIWSVIFLFIKYQLDKR